MHRVRVPLRLLAGLILLSLALPVHSDLTEDDWLHLVSDDFEMVTNLGDTKARALFRHVQTFQPIAERFVPTPARSSKPPLKMLVLKSRRDFVRLMKPKHFAAFAQPSLEQTLLVIAPSGRDQTLRNNTRHEYTHYLMRSVPLGYPLWYEEGMASLMGAMDITESGNILNIASNATTRPLVRPAIARDAAPLTIDEVLDAREVEDWPHWRLSEFYRTSAQLTHFFMFGHERGFPDRRARLRDFFNDRSDTIHAALDVTREQLRREFSRYVRQRRIELLKVPLATKVDEFRIDPAPRMEVLQLLALAAEKNNPERSIAYLTTILDTNPEKPDTLAELSRLYALQGDRERSQAKLDEAKTMDPDAASVLLQEASMAIRGCYRVSDTCHEQWRKAAALTRRALDDDPSRVDGIYLLGISELYTGQPGQAVNYLRIAYDHAPWSPRINFRYGECLRLIGDRRARTFLTNARNWAASETWRTLAEQALAEL